jgi:cytochrome P450
MAVRFTPPYPLPHRSKSGYLTRFVRGWRSWLDVFFEKSYTMKLGEVHIPALSFYVANELPLVRRVLEEEVANFPKHGFLRGLLDPLIGNSVFAASGEEWAEQRAMVNPAFGHTALKRVFALMSEAVDDFVARLSAQDLARPVEIDPFVTHVAADIIFRTLFSRPLTEAESREIYDGFHAYQRHAQRAVMLRLYKLPQLGFGRRATRDAGRIHAVFAAEVAARFAATQRGERRTADGGDDILQSLIDARHPETGRTFTQAEVMEQISTIFLAGHETSASAITWALYLLARDPALQEQVRGEAGAGPLAHADLRGLTVTRDVFRETLRLYPPVSFLVREVTCPVIMRDKQLKKGGMVVVSPWLIQRSRDNFPEPHGFDPGRFTDPDQAAACRHAYLPFGKGPRLCVGAGFANQEALLAIAGVVRAFRLAPVEGDVPEPVSRLTLRPGNGVRLHLTPAL